MSIESLQYGQAMSLHQYSNCKLFSKKVSAEEFENNLVGMEKLSSNDRRRIIGQIVAFAFACLLTGFILLTTLAHRKLFNHFSSAIKGQLVRLPPAFIEQERKKIVNACARGISTLTEKRYSIFLPTQQFNSVISRLLLDHLKKSRLNMESVLENLFGITDSLVHSNWSELQRMYNEAPKDNLRILEKSASA